MDHMSGMKDGMKAKKKKSSSAKHGHAGPKHGRPKRTIIDHHTNGSHSVEHEHEQDPTMPPMSNTKYAVADDEGLRDGMEQHVMQPNPGEAQADAGQSGTAAAAAPMIPGAGA